MEPVTQTFQSPLFSMSYQVTINLILWIIGIAIVINLIGFVVAICGYERK
jgi:subtilase family serine protease